MDGFLSEKRNPGWAMSFLEDDLTIEFSFISRSLAPSSGRDLESLLYSLDQRPQNVGNQ